MAAGKKRKARQSLQPPKQKHRLSLNSASDYVVSRKKRARALKHHRSVDKKLSSDVCSKIRKEALKQQKEVFEEEKREGKSNASFPDFSADVDTFDGFSDTLCQYDGGELEIDEEDEKILATFMRKETGPQLTLADIILQRIKEKDIEVAADAKSRSELDDIISNLKGVGQILHQYTSGRMPNAFKRILALDLWEEFLCLTEPQNWSANAMYQATRIIAYNMDAKKVRIFYQNILLPCVRDDIRKNGRLHFALYQSLKVAFFKPAAFNKGFLFPLCESGTCSLREAAKIGSIIIKKVSIPFRHASAALVTLAQMDYCGTTSYFIKVFLDKKYSFPYRVLDAVLEHFMSFLGKQTIMPVIWHRSLLSFVQRYKNELQSHDKDNLRRLVQHQNHYLVTPEIKRELRSSRNRGEREDDVMSTSSVSVVNNRIEDRWDVPEVPMED